MSRLQEIFGRLRVVLPVIHVANEKQASRNARIASHAGADGIFLINHSGSYDHLLAIAQKVISVSAHFSRDLGSEYLGGDVSSFPVQGDADGPNEFDKGGGAVA
jgi:hypothetical protein